MDKRKRFSPKQNIIIIGLCSKKLTRQCFMSDKEGIQGSMDFGSEELNKLVFKLQSSKEPRKRYEYLLWLAKSLSPLPKEFLNESIKVKGCISQVYVLGKISKGKLSWQGYSDALITKGMLALLIKGLNNLSPEEILAVDTKFIEATGLKSSLTPSRANGFLNIFLNMKKQASAFL